MLNFSFEKKSIQQGKHMRFGFGRKPFNVLHPFYGEFIQLHQGYSTYQVVEAHIKPIGNYF